ncbi:dd0cbea8-d1a7-4ad8-8446-d5409b164d8d [Sclerotinia trifoliorum]|uniref:Dd0cbea8-d1a7-4ad8-8446-d5409b164d8d n=1 Tax=Sclerotinia trifoliorum TaxID=28548 RepID=A0A8H2W626_9HELO|nr:dd0cbea8-d1a7-4ad8-8446-d5409b164d8d [Sclerotinia trifoliorum]
MSTKDNSNSTQQPSEACSVPSINPQYSSNSAHSRQVPRGSDQADPPPYYEEAQRVWHSENSRSSDMNSTLSEAADVSDAEANRPLITDGFEGYAFTEPIGSDNARS